jgi:CheY-like chemotaxis protein
MNDEIKIAFFGEFETDEITGALKRLGEYIINKEIKIDIINSSSSSDNEYDLIIIDLKKDKNGKSSSQNEFIKFLINKKNENLPYCLILGAEKSLDIFNSKKYGRISDIQLFTQLCPEYYQYLSIPFEIKEFFPFFKNFKKNKKPNPFKDFAERIKDINNMFQDTYKINLNDPVKIFKEAGKCCLKEYIETEMREIIHKRGKEKEEDLKVQIYQLLIAMILRAKEENKKLNLEGPVYKDEENKKLNFVIIEDNLEGPVYRDKELGEILGLIGKVLNVEFWLLDDFEGLRKFLIKELNLREKGGFEKGKIDELNDKGVEVEEIVKKRKGFIIKKNQHLQLKVNYNKNKEVDIDCIIIDILLKDKKGKFYDGIEILNLLTNTFPEIPTLILSKSSEGADIKNAFEKGISYYVLKERTLTFPYYYYQHLDDLGKIISFIKIKEDKNKKDG